MKTSTPTQETHFKPEEHLMKLPRRMKDKNTGQYIEVHDDYLEVKWRLVWFRDRFPNGTIETREMCIDLDREVTIETKNYGRVDTKTGKGYARFRATVTDGHGGMATGTGTCTAAEFGDYVEKAETVSIGRALAALGIGTQFVGAELDERERPSDAPVSSQDGHGLGDVQKQERPQKRVEPMHQEPNKVSPTTPVTAASGTPPEALHPTQAQLDSLRELAKSTDPHLNTWLPTIRQMMGRPKLEMATDAFLRREMTMGHYAAVEAYYAEQIGNAVNASATEAEDGEAMPEFDAPEPESTQEAQVIDDTKGGIYASVDQLDKLKKIAAQVVPNGMDEVTSMMKRYPRGIEISVYDIVKQRLQDRLKTQQTAQVAS